MSLGDFVRKHRVLLAILAIAAAWSIADRATASTYDLRTAVLPASNRGWEVVPIYSWAGPCDASAEFRYRWHPRGRAPKPWHYAAPQLLRGYFSGWSNAVILAQFNLRRRYDIQTYINAPCVPGEHRIFNVVLTGLLQG